AGRTSADANHTNPVTHLTGRYFFPVAASNPVVTMPPAEAPVSSTRVGAMTVSGPTSPAWAGAPSASPKPLPRWSTKAPPSTNATETKPARMSRCIVALLYRYARTAPHDATDRPDRRVPGEGYCTSAGDRRQGGTSGVGMTPGEGWDGGAPVEALNSRPGRRRYA